MIKYALNPNHHTIYVNIIDHFYSNDELAIHHNCIPKIESCGGCNTDKISHSFVAHGLFTTSTWPINDNPLEKSLDFNNWIYIVPINVPFLPIT